MASILIVDDNERLRESLDRALSQAGYLTLTAADGAVALRMLTDVQVDMVITDIYMPEVDGIEVLTRMLQRVPEARVIAMSAGGSLGRDELLEDARLLGAVEVIAKPFGMEELLTLVERALGQTVAESG